MRWPFILAVLLVAVVPVPGLADITGPVRIIDGDTIDIAGERIRLHGTDAPESGQTCVADGERWPCGQSATAALAAFIGGGGLSAAWNKAPTVTGAPSGYVQCEARISRRGW